MPFSNLPSSTRSNAAVPGPGVAGEKETLGLYLTGHPINQYEAHVRAFHCTKLVNLVANRRGQNSRVAGLILSMRVMVTKAGKR